MNWFQEVTAMLKLLMGFIYHFVIFFACLKVCIGKIEAHIHTEVDIKDDIPEKEKS
jgi:hypothetical protein